MKKISFLMIAFLMPFMLVATTKDQSKFILEQVRKSVDKAGNMEVAFEFTVNNSDLDIIQKNKGVLKVDDQKYNMQVPDVGITVISDGKSVWNYMENGNQVTITDIEEQSNEIMNPSMLFSIYDHGYNSKYISSKTINGIAVDQIELTAQNNDKEFSNITLFVNKKTQLPQKVVIKGKDGSNYTIDVLSIKTQSQFIPTTFTFNPTDYKDIEVIDFR